MREKTNNPGLIWQQLVCMKRKGGARGEHFDIISIYTNLLLSLYFGPLRLEREAKARGILGTLPALSLLYFLQTFASICNWGTFIVILKSQTHTSYSFRRLASKAANLQVGSEVLLELQLISSYKFHWKKYQLWRVGCMLLLSSFLSWNFLLLQQSYLQASNHTGPAQVILLIKCLSSLNPRGPSWVFFSECITEHTPQIIYCFVDCIPNIIQPHMAPSKVRPHLNL